jgi:hypothetical protein
MTKVGTLVEDLTGTPATGFVVAELVLAPPVVDPTSSTSTRRSRTRSSSRRG